MKLQSSMMITPNLLSQVQQKWMLISQSTASRSVQEKFSIKLLSAIRIGCSRIYPADCIWWTEKKTLFGTNSFNSSWKVLKLMLRMQDQVIGNLWMIIQSDSRYSQENSDLWLTKSDPILNRKKGIFIKINQAFS